MSILIEDGSNVTRCGDRTAGAFESVGGCGGEGGLSFSISMLETSEMSSEDGCCRGGDRCMIGAGGRPGGPGGEPVGFITWSDNSSGFEPTVIETGDEGGCGAGGPGGSEGPCSTDVLGVEGREGDFDGEGGFAGGGIGGGAGGWSGPSNMGKSVMSPSVSGSQAIDEMSLKSGIL